MWAKCLKLVHHWTRLYHAFNNESVQLSANQKESNSQKKGFETAFATTFKPMGIRGASCFAMLKPRKKVTSLCFHGTELRNGATLLSHNVDRTD